ncbi:amylo-alpha-1,6-glucosidase [Peribacillus muralis]|uniref:amylo-alpha-1,6-glucosidase n=1 Tax=Peribacillus muralis TaxID=264697 RepID=UPI001F4E0E32|nr:amylo-alpha-1,6-glucosidase [Peribacillus muralis]MCK1993470.1 amylo-alpha-1,6-glucosidase [Peribacillus muralis]MCK2014242.1 amylo-alpha-1,6-glucosidase [Peribacillus muralis]
MDYRVIKENDLFLLTDESGNITENHQYGLGLYAKDTRFLNKLNIKINGEDPVLLSSKADENYMATILLTNPHMENDEEVILWRESVEIQRKRFINKGILYEALKFKNYSPKLITFSITVEVDADFKDMFIVRGFQTGNVGKRTGQVVNEKSLIFTYQGTDNLCRETYISWDKAPSKITETGEITFDFTLEHAQEEEVVLTIRPQMGEEDKNQIIPMHDALNELKNSYKLWESSTTNVKTDHKTLQRLITRGLSDIRVLLTDVGYGPFPVAGLPWYGVLFGRDSLITALQMLPFNPEVAKGTLRTLAVYQGKENNPWRDEQPGKIMHEIRYGELANTNQIPFTPYYGTVDATPLFLILLTEYVKWTGDFELLHDLKANVEAAFTWINEYGDRDGDLFVEYHQESSKGIANQGWKDSGDAVVHRNGDFAKSPIALAEVQGYVYQAKMGIASLYQAVNKQAEAKLLIEEAAHLKEKFDEQFWMEDLSFYAIALDQNKEKVSTITSNPGHVLLSEMLDEDKANKVATMLLSEKMYSGYGIRTMGEDEAAYNPISYHDGSIWPHDNSLILLGLSKIGKQQEANKVMHGLMQAAEHFEFDRLPELFCGYSATLGQPVKYPVACSPHAWAAATPLTSIQSLLQLFPNSPSEEIHLNPCLLDDMNELNVQGMNIGKGILSITVKKEDGETFVTIDENTTGYTVVSSSEFQLIHR